MPKKYKRKKPYKRPYKKRKYKYKKYPVKPTVKKLWSIVRSRKPELKTKLISFGNLTTPLDFYAVAGVRNFGNPTYWHVLNPLPTISTGATEQDRLGSYTRLNILKMKLIINFFPKIYARPVPVNSGTLAHTLMDNNQVGNDVSGCFHCRVMFVKVPVGGVVVADLATFDRTTFVTPGLETLFDSTLVNSGLIRNTGKLENLNQIKLIKCTTFKVPNVNAFTKTLKFYCKLKSDLQWVHNGVVPVKWTWFLAIKFFRNGIPIDYNDAKWNSPVTTEYNGEFMFQD